MLPSVNKLRERNRKLTTAMERSFELVSAKCARQISETPPIRTYTVFTVPRLLPDSPMYSCSECLLYLKSKLERSGYKVTYSHPRQLYIDWSTPSNVTCNQLEQSLRQRYPNVQFEFIRQ